MRYILTCFIFFTTLVADGLEVDASFGLVSDFFPNEKKGKNKNSFTANQELEFTYTKDEFKAYTKLYAQEAYHDLVKDESKHTNRTFARVDEAYLEYEGDNFKLNGGKVIKFWGALEVKNISDVFNLREFRNKPSNNEKLGSYFLEYDYYTDDGTLSLIAKLYEDKQYMASQPYQFYFLPFFISYDSELKSDNSLFYPTFYLKYSASTQWENALDYSLILQHGYDSQRYFLPDDFSTLKQGLPTTFNEHAYLVNKIITYNTMLVDNTLYKLEALYTDVIDSKYISDYMHLGLGFEYTFNNIFNLDSNLGLIGEYYYYTTFEDNKFTDLELFEIYQNDLFLGLRYSFNDEDDSSIVAGVVADVEYGEELYSFKYETRFFDSLKFKTAYSYINPSKNTQTAYNLLGETQTITFDFKYYF